VFSGQGSLTRRQKVQAEVREQLERTLAELALLQSQNSKREAAMQKQQEEMRRMLQEWKDQYMSLQQVSLLRLCATGYVL
jgi:hypothetical protein